jgi:3D (Asp-Asp-Asp) domain-containing protein
LHSNLGGHCMSLRAKGAPAGRKGTLKSVVRPFLIIFSAVLAFFGSVAVNAQNGSPVAPGRPQTPKQVNPEPSNELTLETPKSPLATEDVPVQNAFEVAVPAQDYTATAYSLNGRTASGEHVRRGIIAADPRVLPLGSVVKLHAGSYTGIYHVKDTGGKIKGRRIDIYMPSTTEARRFGRQAVRIEVLRRTRPTGGKSTVQAIPASKKKPVRQ